MVLPIGFLGLGRTGPFMNTVFVLSGLTLLIGVVGIFQSIRQMSPIARWSCIAALVLSPIGLIVDGIVTIDSMFLYTARFKWDLYSVGFLLPFVSLVHSVGFLMTVASPVLSFLLTGILLRRIQRWRRFGSWLLLGSPLTLGLLVLFFATFNLFRAGEVTQPVMTLLLRLGGLTNRLLILEVHAWFVTLGWLAFRRSGS